MITDWNKLNANEVPKWIIGLMSSSAEQQHQSFGKLSNYLGEHAFALNIGNNEFNAVLETDVPILITSFLLEMLDHSSSVNLVYILRLLETVASYIQEPKLGQLQAERAKRISELIIEKYESYLNILNHSDPEVRAEVIIILCNIPSKHEEIAINLLQRLKSGQITKDAEVLTTVDCIYGITKNTGLDVNLIKSEFVMILEQIINHDDTSDSVLIGATCFLLLLQGSHVSTRVINLLTNMLKNAQSGKNSEILSYSHIWINGLHSLGIEKATEILLEVFKHQHDVYILFYVSAILLRMHFLGLENAYLLHVQIMDTDRDYKIINVSFEPDIKITSKLQIGELSELQINILARFLQKSIIWNNHTNLFELFGLPNKKSELAELLEE